MRVFAYRNTVEEVQRSSSGGAFIRICKAFEDIHGENNVVFYGATLLENLSVVHTVVYSAEACHIFQGSKYVKSDLANCIKSIEFNLNAGKWVLFSGTPCQVYAVKRMAEKKRISDRLFLIDVLCHGTAKKSVWVDYVQWLSEIKNSELVEFSFRYKPEGWKAYPGYARFNDGKKMINTAETSVFSRLHLIGYSIDKGCFKCPFTSLKRNGDITLGDYWGIESINSDIKEISKGISLIMCKTEYAQEIIENIQNKSKECNDFIQETNDVDFIKYQDNLKGPTSKPKNYEQFWIDYMSSNFDDCIRKYIGWGVKYKAVFYIKKYVRKTPVIEMWRKIKYELKK